MYKMVYLGDGLNYFRACFVRALYISFKFSYSIQVFSFAFVLIRPSLAAICPFHSSSPFIVKTLRTVTLHNVAAYSFSRLLFLITFLHILIVTSLSILYLAFCWLPLQGAFLKLRKVTIIFVISVRPSTWNNSAPTGQIFVKLDFWVLPKIWL